MRRIAIYTRTLAADKAAHTAQVSACKTLAQTLGGDVVAYYEDSAAGSTLDRPALKELYRDAFDRKFDTVLATSLDRLSYTPRQLVRLAINLNKAGVSIHTTENGECKDVAANEQVLFVRSRANKTAKETLVIRLRGGKGYTRLAK
jgi:DNA invertase Pin-like site-specific DNA recombinase